MTNKLKQDIAQILRDNITFSPQTGDFIIHGAIEKIIEYFQLIENQSTMKKADRQKVFDLN